MTKKEKRAPGGDSAKQTQNFREPEDFDTQGRNDSRRIRTEKRAKFVKPAKSSGSNLNIIYVAVPAALIIIVGVILFMQNQSAANATASGGGGAAAAGAIREVPIQMNVADGKITISADDVRKNKLVTFDYTSGGKTVPLTAWVTPSGAIKTAVRTCEPCNGHSFRIEGNVIVCNVCGTRWNLETLKGISGGCQAYPPDSLPGVTNGDLVTIDEGVVKNWKPRA